MDNIWEKAITNNTNNNNDIIPNYNYKYLNQLLIDYKITNKLPLIFEKLLQDYLNKNNNINNNDIKNVLILLDIAITCCLNISNTTKLNEDKFYFIIINLLETFCEFLSFDKLNFVVLYLSNRTLILCKLSSKWILKLKKSNKLRAESNLELPILKFCNKILLRLKCSSSNNIEISGKFLIFMSNFVDIDSRSGQNFLGQFHLENITNIEDDEDDDLDNDNNNDNNKTDKKLYYALWELQDIFRDPRRIGTKQNEIKFNKFRNNLDLILNIFKNNIINNDEANCHFKTKIDKTNSKYLTSLKLFNKQINNPSFRRFILIQSLIFLSSHKVNVPSDRPKLTHLNKFNNKNNKEWIINKYNEILNEILPNIPPNGYSFTQFVKYILQYDENWLIWKYNIKNQRCLNLKRSINNNCPYLINNNKEYEPPNKKQKYNMGNLNLQRIFKFTPNKFKTNRNNIYYNNLNQIDKDLDFLHEYDQINFKNKLNSRLDSLLDQYKENKQICYQSLNDHKTIFTNLRIMKDLDHSMFSNLCPMSKNPEPNTFKSQFLFDALKFKSPNIINTINKDDENKKIENRRKRFSQR